MMEIHNYANNGPTTQAGWKSNLLNRLGNAVSPHHCREWAGQLNEDFTTGIDGNADSPLSSARPTQSMTTRWEAAGGQARSPRVEVLRAPACWFRRGPETP